MVGTAVKLIFGKEREVRSSPSKQVASNDFTGFGPRDTAVSFL